MANVIVNKGEEWIIGGVEVVVTDFYAVDGDDEEHIEVTHSNNVVQAFRLSEWVALNPVLKHDLAWDFYVDALNQTRRTVTMVTRTDKLPQKLDPKTRTKHAIMKVLSTQVWIERRDIDKLIEGLGVSRAPRTIRGALRRIVKFGLAEAQMGHNKYNRYGRHSWRMTQRGLQYVNSPDFGKPPIKNPSKTKSNSTQTSAPSGAQGATTMCIDPTKVTLNAAIERCVNILVTSKDKFSAHDVTKALRAAVNTARDVIDENETGTIFVGGLIVPNISHDYVRDAVHELFHTGKMVGYDRQHTGNHWEYSHVSAQVPDPASTPATVSAPDPDVSSDTSPPLGGKTGSDYDGTPVL